MTADEQAARIWAGLRAVLFDFEDRKRETKDELGVSFSKTRALRRLITAPMNMRDLAQAMSTDAPYTTLVVDHLESRGLVTRTVNPEDKRTKIVALTPLGLSLAIRAQEILDRPPKVLLALPDKDLAALDRIVAALLTDGRQ